MSYRRSLDPKDKFLRRFYEPLILLGLLEPTRGVIKSDTISDRGLNEQKKLWRGFLDHSSFLCDSEKGGDTVTAIATERTFERSVFWLASNSASRHRARDHLAWILSCLERLNHENTSAQSVEDEIFDRCIRFSSKRISTYADWLKSAVDRTKRQKQNSMTAEDERLFATLQQFEVHLRDHRALCTLANACRSSESFQILSQRHDEQDQRNAWSEIRHLVGRLGLWTKAVRFLIRGARRFPHYIENAWVEVVGPEQPSDVPCASHLTGLEGVINRAIQTNEAAMAKELIEALTELDEMTEIGKSFHQKYSNLKPRPHAELLVLEKFHRGALEFVHDDRYIGCSKPSCYCCYLYMQCHPGHFAPRPCHGNLWVNWAPPIPLPPASKGGAGAEGKLLTRFQDHHSFKILQRMLISIRGDLKEQILSRRPKRARLPDSTTGISSVLALANQVLLRDVSGAQTVASLPPPLYEDDNTGVKGYGHDQSTGIEHVESESSDSEDMVVFKGRQPHALLGISLRPNRT